MTICEGSAAPSIKVMLLSLEFSPELSGGVGTHALELANGLGQMGHQVTVLAYASGKSMVVDNPNIKLHLIPPSNSSLRKATKQSMVQGILSFNDDLAAYGRSLIERAKRELRHYPILWLADVFGGASIA